MKQKYLTSCTAHLLLIIICLLGFSTDHTIILVSRLPLAISMESGDQAIVFTLALWKTHS